MVKSKDGFRKTMSRGKRHNGATAIADIADFIFYHQSQSHIIAYSISSNYVLG